MIKRIFALFLFFTFAGTAFSAKPLVAFKVDSLWHFVGDDGKELFQPKKLNEVFCFSEGFFRVNFYEGHNLVWGFLDAKGDLKIRLNSDFADDFSNGRALIYKKLGYDESTKKFGYIDRTGKMVTDYVFDDATDFSEGYAFVMNALVRGFIDTTCEIKIPLVDKAANQFKEGLADVNTSAFKIGFMNTDGELIVPYKYDETAGFSEGLANVGTNGKFGYIDRSGKMVIFPLYDYARPFHNDRAFVGISDEKYKTIWGLIDRTGKMITYYVYNKVEDFSDGLAPVLKNGTWGYIGIDGVYKIETGYFYADKFVDGLAWISDHKKNITGFIDINNQIKVTIPKADKVIDLRNGRLLYQ